MTKFPKGSFIVRNGERRKILAELEDARFLSWNEGYDNWETSVSGVATVQSIERDGWKVEEPKEEWPKKGVDYWTLADIGYENPILKSNWANDWIDQKRLKRGLVFRTQEEAQAWFDKTFGKDNSLEEKKEGMNWYLKLVALLFVVLFGIKLFNWAMWNRYYKPCEQLSGSSIQDRG